MVTIKERLAKLETKQQILLYLMIANLGVDIVPIAGAAVLNFLAIYL